MSEQDKLFRFFVILDGSKNYLLPENGHTLDKSKAGLFSQSDFDFWGWYAYKKEELSQDNQIDSDSEIDRLRHALNEHVRYNTIRNDRDMYLLEVASWALHGHWGENGEFTERPNPADFGLGDVDGME